MSQCTWCICRLPVSVYGIDGTVMVDATRKEIRDGFEGRARLLDCD